MKGITRCLKDSAVFLYFSHSCSFLVHALRVTSAVSVCIFIMVLHNLCQVVKSDVHLFPPLLFKVAVYKVCLL